MSTTGTSVFNLDVNDLIEEAFERCGQELRTGYNFRTARRSLNLLTIEWANRGINLWTIEEGQIPLYPNQIIYALPTDTIDLLDQVTRTGSGTNQQDLNLNRISESTYSTIPNKNASGRPIQFWINRQSGESNTTTATIGGASTLAADATTIPVNNIDQLGSTGFILVDSEVIVYSAVDTVNGNLLYCSRGQNGTTAATHVVGSAITVQNLPCVNIWPVPNQGSTGNPYYTLVYWRMRRIQDTGTGVKTQDIPFRFLECMVAGLAYKLSMKLPDVDPNRVMALKAEYEQQFQLASEEDRDKSNDRFVPRVQFYR
jgi:hypothetical protein